LGASPAGEIRDVMLGRMAQAVFDEHPEANGLSLQLESIQMPTLAEFVQGKTPSYKLVYGYDFTRETPSRP
ncbi:MAG: hypothetical protein ABI992_01525, partial [Chthoniobacterales bacterium]